MPDRVADSAPAPKSSQIGVTTGEATIGQATIGEATTGKATTDASGLAEALRSQMRGGFHGDVRFDSGARALYATDGSNYRQIPIGVVLPHDADDVLAA